MHELRQQHSGDIATQATAKPLGGYPSVLPLYVDSIARVPLPGEHPRIDWHLDNWARYMRDTELHTLDHRTAQYWAHGSSDFDTLADTVELVCAQATDAVVQDLPMQQCRCIHYVMLGMLYTYDHGTIRSVFDEARRAVGFGLLRKGIP